MSNIQKESKFMSISDISKRMTTRSQAREQSSTSAPNPPKLTNTEPTNITVDGYTSPEDVVFGVHMTRQQKMYLV